MSRRRVRRPDIVVLTAAPCGPSKLFEPAGESADAQLLAACDRYLTLEEFCAEEYRRKAPGHMTRIRATRDERDRLEAFIVQTKAATDVGRCAKAEVAVIVLGAGTWGDVAKSALRDFQSVAGAS